MAKGDHKFKSRAAGSTNGGYARPRVQIGFDPQTVATITALAKIHNRSFAAEVRALVEFAFDPSVQRIKDAVRLGTIERCATIALEQRCERGTPWDSACVAIAAAIRAQTSGQSEAGSS